MTCTETFVDDIAGIWCDAANDPRNRKKGQDNFILKGAGFPIGENFRNNLIFIGYGRVLLPRKELFCEKPVTTGIAVKLTRPVFDSPPISNAFLKSLSTEAMLQNYGSIQICKTLLQSIKVERDEDCKLFDMCAAPGGKTAYLINALPSCTWYAADKPSRVEMITNNTSKISKNLNIVSGDSTATAFSDEFFDGILLDAPCSATGSRPKPVIGKLSDRQVKSYQKLQRKLLHEAIRILRPGGVLVYSTCSILSCENSDNVSYMLEKYHNLKLENEVSFNPFSGDCQNINGIQHISAKGGKLDTIGFFCAQFRK